jgi:hypothetical protein
MRVEQGRSTIPKACAASPQRKHDVFENLTREAEDAVDRAALDIDREEQDYIPWEQVKTELGLS